MPKLKKVKPGSSVSSEKKKKIVKYSFCLIWGIVVMVIGIFLLSFAYLKLESRPTVIYYLTYLVVALGHLLSVICLLTS